VDICRHRRRPLSVVKASNATNDTGSTSARRQLHALNSALSRRNEDDFHKAETTGTGFVSRFVGIRLLSTPISSLHYKRAAFRSGAISN
jgi:hypothetical protein